MGKRLTAALRASEASLRISGKRSSASFQQAFTKGLAGLCCIGRVSIDPIVRRLGETPRRRKVWYGIALIGVAAVVIFALNAVYGFVAAPRRAPALSGP